MVVFSVNYNVADRGIRYFSPGQEMDLCGQGTIRILVEQGHEIGKYGRVRVKVSKNEKSYDIEITGTAVYVKEFEIVFAANVHNMV